MLAYELPKQQKAEEIWTHSQLLSGQTNLLHSMADELSQYTGQPIDLVLHRMSTAEDEFAELWNGSSIRPTDTAALHQFYNAGLVEAFELMNWHAGGTGRVPIQPVMALWLAQQLGCTRVLDYGSGVGSASILFSRHDFEVDLADISKPLLELASWRMAHRGQTSRSFLLPEQTPPGGAYDMILCFDVAEHVPDPAALMTELAGYLRVGGIVVGTFYEDSTNDRHPMHISSCGPLADFARKTPLWVDWKLTDQIKSWGGWSAVFKKRHAGSWLRNLERTLTFGRHEAACSNGPLQNVRL